jgi:hypothetical protein
MVLDVDLALVDVGADESEIAIGAIPACFFYIIVYNYNHRSD